MLYGMLRSANDYSHRLCWWWLWSASYTKETKYMAIDRNTNTNINTKYDIKYKYRYKRIIRLCWWRLSASRTTETRAEGSSLGFKTSWGWAQSHDHNHLHHHHHHHHHPIVTIIFVVWSARLPGDALSPMIIKPSVMQHLACHLIEQYIIYILLKWFSLEFWLRCFERLWKNVKLELQVGWLWFFYSSSNITLFHSDLHVRERLVIFAHRLGSPLALPSSFLLCCSHTLLRATSSSL